MVRSSPTAFIRRVIATEPPAPMTLVTSNDPPVMSPFSMTATAARPVWS